MYFGHECTCSNLMYMYMYFILYTTVELCLSESNCYKEEFECEGMISFCAGGGA